MARDTVRYHYNVVQYDVVLHIAEIIVNYLITIIMQTYLKMLNF